MLAATVLATMDITYSHRFQTRTGRSRTCDPFPRCLRAMEFAFPPHRGAPRDGYLETPSQCLHCERLFKLNWCFCNPALSDRSGRRIWGPGQREEHCGGADVGPRRCRRPARPVSKAIVAALQRRLGEIDPGETKMALFLALYCLFTRLHARVRLLKLS